MKISNTLVTPRDSVKDQISAEYSNATPSPVKIPNKIKSNSTFQPKDKQSINVPIDDELHKTNFDNKISKLALEFKLHKRN
jgi:hypothetical protein